MPRRGPRNIVKGRGEAVLGVKELAAKFKDLREAMSASQQSKYRHEIYKVLGASATEIKKTARQMAEAQGVPKEIVNSIFTFADPDKGPVRRRPSALVGTSKQQTMVEWRAGAHPATQSLEGRALVIKRKPGEKLAMSLATMWEFGTSRMRAKPFFRPAVVAARWRALDVLEKGLVRMIESITGRVAAVPSQSIGGEFL